MILRYLQRTSTLTNVMQYGMSIAMTQSSGWTRERAGNGTVGNCRCALRCRNPIPYRPVEERAGDWGEVVAHLPEGERGDLLNTQSARCMNCGTPFCHQTSSGAPRLGAAQQVRARKCCKARSWSVSAIAWSTLKPTLVTYGISTYHQKSSVSHSSSPTWIPRCLGPEGKSGRAQGARWGLGLG